MPLVVFTLKVPEDLLQAYQEWGDPNKAQRVRDAISATIPRQRGIREIEILLRDASRRLELRLRKGGLYSFFELLVEIRAMGRGVAIGDLHVALLDLEKREVVDLQVANDPTLADRDIGIWKPERGLLYYLVWR